MYRLEAVFGVNGLHQVLPLLAIGQGVNFASTRFSKRLCSKSSLIVPVIHLPQNRFRGTIGLNLGGQSAVTSDGQGSDNRAIRRLKRLEAIEVGGNMDRNMQTLDRIDAAQMAPGEFAAYAIVLGVEPCANPSSTRRLQVNANHAADLEEVRTEIQRRLPAWRRGLSQDEREQIESRFLLALMSVDLESDAMCNRILGGRPLVMARSEVVRRHGRMAVAQAAHRIEVSQALAERKPVHGESLAQYGLRQPAAAVEAAAALA